MAHILICKRIHWETKECDDAMIIQVSPQAEARLMEQLGDQPGFSSCFMIPLVAAVMVLRYC